MWRGHLSIAFAHIDFGAEFGPGDERLTLPQYGRWSPFFDASEQLQTRDLLQLLVFVDDHEPTWSGLAADVKRLISLDAFESGPLAWDLSHEYGLTYQHNLAFALFHSSRFEINPEAAYVLLITAIEVLLPDAEEDGRISPTLDALTAKLYEDEFSDLESSVRERVEKILIDAKAETIGRRARELAKALLKNERYDGDKPSQFITASYDVRSNLVHGNPSRLDDDELWESFLSFDVSSWNS